METEQQLSVRFEAEFTSIAALESRMLPQSTSHGPGTT